jgi:pyruvate ferredoxin oxidoreductase beta subunit
MGKPQLKKDLPTLVADHDAPYVATASVAYLKDLRKKVEKAMTYHGPRYIQIDTPCPSGWGFSSELALEIGRLGVNCGLVPLFEMENGNITRVRKIRKKLPVAEYLKAQSRFKHLLQDEGTEYVKQLQDMADRNISKYALMGSSKN